MHKFDISNIAKLDNPGRRKTLPPDEILLKFGVKDDGVFLDVGCGTGYFTIPAAGIVKNNRVIGIDITPEMLAVAKDKVTEIPNIELRKSEEYSFPVDDNSVKYVLISNVIHEVVDKIKYLGEVRRVMREDGYLLIIDWQKKETKMGPPVHERISEEDMKKLCSSAGFELIDELGFLQNHYGLKFKVSF